MEKLEAVFYMSNKTPNLGKDEPPELPVKCLGDGFGFGT